MNKLDGDFTKGPEFIKMSFPDAKFRKRKRGETDNDIILRGVSKMGMSVIHRDVLDSLPKDKGLWCRALKFCPCSYQSKAGKRFRYAFQRDLELDSTTSKIKEMIKDQHVEVLILYKLVSKRTKRDIDNYTKNIIDSMKKLLFDDDMQIKFLASKIEYIEYNRKYSRGLEKAIVRIDFFEKSELCSDFDKVFSNNG